MSNMNTYEKFRRMMDNHIMLSFKGEITSDIITMVLQIMETKLDNVSDNEGSVGVWDINREVQTLIRQFQGNEYGILGRGVRNVWGTDLFVVGGCGGFISLVDIIQGSVIKKLEIDSSVKGMVTFN